MSEKMVLLVPGVRLEESKFNEILELAKKEAHLGGIRLVQSLFPLLGLKGAVKLYWKILADHCVTYKVIKVCRGPEILSICVGRYAFEITDKGPQFDEVIFDLQDSRKRPIYEKSHELAMLAWEGDMYDEVIDRLVTPVS